MENPRTRWEDVFQRDELQILGIRGWRRRAGDREQWRSVLREARSQQRSNWMDGLFRKLEEQQTVTIKCKPYVIQTQWTRCAITQTDRVTALSLWIIYQFIYRSLNDAIRISKYITSNIEKVKVKQSHYRSGHALRVSGGWGSPVSRQSAYESGKFVSPRHRPPLLQEMFMVLISVRGWVNPWPILRLEELCQWKIPVTTSGI